MTRCRADAVLRPNTNAAATFNVQRSTFNVQCHNSIVPVLRNTAFC